MPRLIPTARAHLNNCLSADPTATALIAGKYRTMLCWGNSSIQFQRIEITLMLSQLAALCEVCIQVSQSQRQRQEYICNFVIENNWWWNYAKSLCSTHSHCMLHMFIRLGDNCLFLLALWLIFLLSASPVGTRMGMFAFVHEEMQTCSHWQTEIMSINCSRWKKGWFPLALIIPSLIMC